MSPEEIQIIKDSLDPITDREMERLYCEMLDECYEPVKVAGYEYSTSDALARLDPVAFRCGLADFTSDEMFTEVDGEYYYTNEIEDLF